MKKLSFILILYLALFSSCRQQKELIYFTGLQDSTIVNRSVEEQREYKIRVNDILYIKIMTLDPIINQLFNSSEASGTTSYRYFTEDAMYYMGFSVRQDGTVDIPALGVIPVVGITCEEAKIAIEEKASEQLKAEAQPMVMVKLANFKVTLLGEVLRPGTYTYYNNQTNILEAIGKAGDLTDYGDRKQVLIIRPTVDGSTTFRVNLQDKHLLASPNFFIQPNDVIYVQPLKAKSGKLFTQDYGPMISAVSTTLTAISLIVTFILNVAR